MRAEYLNSIAFVRLKLDERQQLAARALPHCFSVLFWCNRALWFAHLARQVKGIV